MILEKTHYKMYKSGKHWMFAGAMAVAALGTAGATTQAHADDVSGDTTGTQSTNAQDNSVIANWAAAQISNGSATPVVDQSAIAANQTTGSTTASATTTDSQTSTTATQDSTTSTTTNGADNSSTTAQDSTARAGSTTQTESAAVPVDGYNHPDQVHQDPHVVHNLGNLPTTVTDPVDEGGTRAADYGVNDYGYDSTNDDSEKVVNGQLTSAQQEELSDYAASLVNSYRASKGLQPLAVTPNSEAVGQAVSDARTQQNLGYVHSDTSDIVNQVRTDTSNKYNIEWTGENITQYRPINGTPTMTELKTAIANGVTEMIYRDQNPQQHDGHKKNFENSDSTMMSTNFQWDKNSGTYTVVYTLYQGQVQDAYKLHSFHDIKAARGEADDGTDDKNNTPVNSTGQDSGNVTQTSTDGASTDGTSAQGSVDNSDPNAAETNTNDSNPDTGVQAHQNNDELIAIALTGALSTMALAGVAHKKRKH